jgi:NAD(P)-dependent dehydrogenase (short-subunit alcohol dehydrogenase family)
MTANREFAGRRALVTGGTKGIGQAVAAKLREAGATVLITARTRGGAGLDDHHFVAADVTTAAVVRPSPMRCAIGWTASTSSSTL